MADDKIYASTYGFIQFEPESRELDSGAVLRDVTIRSMNTGELLRITFWPEFEELELEKGDLIAVDGTITFRDVEFEDEETGEIIERTYTNMSAYSAVRWEPFAKREVEVVSKSKGGAKKSTAKKARSF